MSLAVYLDVVPPRHILHKPHTTLHLPKILYAMLLLRLYIIILVIVCNRPNLFWRNVFQHKSRVIH